MVKKVIATFPFYLTFAVNVFAQTTTDAETKGGTSSSLPDAGSTELTYAIFLFGVLLFVFGMLRLVKSYRR